MAAPHPITDYFKRPRFSINYRENSAVPNPGDDIPDDPGKSPPARPFDDREPSFQSPLSSPQSLAPPSSFSDEDFSQSGGALGAEEPPLTEPPPPTTAATQPSHTFDGGLSFGESCASSQRVIKNGKEMVISSDGEDTESIESLEAPEELFKQFTKGLDNVQNNHTERKHGPPATGTSTRKYKFSLDSLVTDAVGDQETEAGLAKLKATLEASRRSSSPRTNTHSPRPAGQSKDPREDLLASALGKHDDERELQRVMDAVRRTEAFDREKSWRFFDPHSQILAPPAFPRSAFSPARWEAVMRGKYHDNSDTLACCF